MKKIYNKIFELIKQYETIIIHRHEKPDGDAIGSQLGLKLAILATFPTKNVFVVGDVSERLNFAGKLDDVNDEQYNDALVIVVDSGAEYLISDKRYKNGKYLIKIDHHIPQGEYGDLMLVDTSRESCCGLIADLIKHTMLTMNKEVATMLYLGLVTDSGRFRYSPSSKTFDIASYLIKEKADTEYIYSNLYTDSLENVMLKAKMTLKYEVLDCGVAYIKNSYKECLKLNIVPIVLGKTIINNMSGIKEVTIWASFSEQEDGTIVTEIRSSKYNINKIAVKYGGGGHTQASGATLASWDIVDLMIEDFIKTTKGEEIC